MMNIFCIAKQRFYYSRKIWTPRHWAMLLLLTGVLVCPQMVNPTACVEIFLSHTQEYPKGRLALVASGGDFCDGFATVTITATARDIAGNSLFPSEEEIIWEVVSSSIHEAWWGYGGNRMPNDMNGLTWGDTPLDLHTVEKARVHMDDSGNTTGKPHGLVAQLTDIVGSRTVVMRACASLDGIMVCENIAVSFGPGPLALFAGPPQGNRRWWAASAHCENEANDLRLQKSHASPRMPTVKNIQAVSGNTGRGAAFAAGWPDVLYWTGEKLEHSNAAMVDIYNGAVNLFNISGENQTICLK